MLFFRFLGFWLLQQVCASPTPRGAVFKRADGAFTLKKAEALISDRELKVSDSIMSLNEVNGISQSTKVLLSDATSKTAPLRSIEGGVAYSVNVKLGSETFAAIFDTGSSDLWVARSGFTCYSGFDTTTGKFENAVPEGQCHFGTLFSGGFEEGKIPNEIFVASYGDGEVVTGVLGYEDVTVAGVTVDHQEIALVSKAYFLGDGIDSGIFGFAYPALTSAYTSNGEQVQYTDWISNAIKQNKIDSLFSVVLERGGGQSQVALGGLPTISFDHDFTTTPLEIYDYNPRLEPPDAANKYTYYTIETDGFVLNGNNVGSGIHAVVDTGTTLAYLPNALAKQVNAAFDPPAKIKNGLYETSCNAKAPSFAVTIGGKNFKISAEDLLGPKSFSYDSATGLCVTGIQAVGNNPPILGGTFLKNVVAVFDIGAAKMRFAPHVNY